MFGFNTKDVLALIAMFLKFADNIFAKTFDLPEKIFLTGAQMMHEQLFPKTKFDIKEIAVEAEKTIETLRLQHFWNVQGLASKQRDKMMELIIKGRQENLHPSQIARSLNKDVFEKFSHKALLISRTYVTEAEAKGRIAYAKMLQAKTGKKQFLQANSAPDACVLCKTHLNFIDSLGNIQKGKIFSVDYLAKQKSNLGKTPKQSKPNIPMHFMCRCIFLLTTEEKYKEQQTKIEDGFLKKRSLDEVTRILKKHDKNFNKSMNALSLEKMFETQEI